MLLKDKLLVECKDVIEKVLSQTRLPKNIASEHLVADALVKSMRVAKVTEPTQTPLYLIAEALSSIRESGTWPVYQRELAREIAQLTDVAITTVATSLNRFPWDLPSFLKKKKRSEFIEPVKVVKPKEEEEKVEEVKEEQVVKLNGHYRVVIDFGEFQIRIERTNK